MTNRQIARKMINDAIVRETRSIGVDDLADLPCLMNALDNMQECMDYDDPSEEELKNMAQDAAFELLEEEGWLA